MKLHTTNYKNTFIEIAEDCPAAIAEIPPSKEGKISVANIHFDLIAANPYKYTSDEVVFRYYAVKNDLPDSGWEQEWEKFFSKGQPCLRTSPLAKRYGWGIHCNQEGRVALYGAESEEYRNFLHQPDIKVVKAMRSKRR